MDCVDLSESTELSRLLLDRWRVRARLSLPYSAKLSALLLRQSFDAGRVPCTRISCFFMSLRSSFSRSVTLFWAVFSLSDQSRINLSASAGLACSSDNLSTVKSDSTGTFAFSLYNPSNFASFALTSANSFVSLSFSLQTFLWEASVSLCFLAVFSVSTSMSSICSFCIFNLASFLASSFFTDCKALSAASRL